MNYEIIYSNLITSRINRKKIQNEYYEKHHIWPKSLGGYNDKSNIVKLTAREHFIAHWLLYKITTGKDKIKMSYCFNLMNNMNKSSKLYNNQKIKLWENFKGENNPMYGKGYLLKGKKKSDEHKQKLSKSRIGKKGAEHTKEHKLYMSEKYQGKNNPMYGKKHTKKTKTKISIKIKGRKLSDSHKQKISNSHKGKKRPDDFKKKLSESKKIKVESSIIKNIIDDKKTKITYKKLSEKYNLGIHVIKRLIKEHQ